MYGFRNEPQTLCAFESDIVVIIKLGMLRCLSERVMITRMCVRLRVRGRSRVRAHERMIMRMRMRANASACENGCARNWRGTAFWWGRAFWCLRLAHFLYKEQFLFAVTR